MYERLNIGYCLGESTPQFAVCREDTPLKHVLRDVYENIDGTPSERGQTALSSMKTLEKQATPALT